MNENAMQGCIRRMLATMLVLAAVSCGGGGTEGDSGDAEERDDAAGDGIHEPEGDGLETDILSETEGGDAVQDTPEEEAVEAPEPAVAIDCADTLQDVYVTPSGLPPMTELLRGEIVRCAREKTLTAEEVAARLTRAGVGDVTASTGVEILLVAYRTERMGTTPGVGTARIFLPLESRPGADPMVVSNHGTVGLADSCVPSKADTQQDYLILPFAGTGWPVIAPDYAGLGNEGVQGYGRNDDTGHSVLDASRALMKLVTPGSLSGDIVLTGHSQGGGATLAGTALGPSYGGAGTIRAAVPFAPGWQYKETNPAVYQYPNLIPADFILLMSLYADAANALGEDHATDYFEPSLRADVEDAVSTLCVAGLAVWVPSHASTLEDLLDPAFILSVQDCTSGGSCIEPASGFLERSASNILPLSSEAPPVLYVQGLQDTLRTPESAQCMVETMTEQGAVPQLCVDPEATHMNIVERNIGLALRWVEAVLGGGELPRCDNETLPACY